MKSKCCIHGETCPGPAGAGTFSSSSGSQACSGRGRAWTGQNPNVFLCPHTGTTLSLGAPLTAGGQRAWIQLPVSVLATSRVTLVTLLHQGFWEQWNWRSLVGSCGWDEGRELRSILCQRTSFCLAHVVPRLCP